MENSGFGRLVTVLTSPGKTFRSIAERPTWAAPLAVFFLVTAVQVYVVHQRTDYREVMEWTLASQGREMDAEQLDTMVEVQERFGAIGAPVGAVFVILLSLLFALLYWVGIKLVGGELTYKQALSVSLYSGIPMAVQAILSVAVLWPVETVAPERVASRNFLASNLAFLAPEDAGPVLINLLASLDFFAFWSLVLAAIGYRIAARVSTVAAATVVAVIWLLGVGIRLGFAAMSGTG